MTFSLGAFLIRLQDIIARDADLKEQFTAFFTSILQGL
jgi:hypothetical protein